MKIIFLIVFLGAIAFIGGRHPVAKAVRPAVFAGCGMALGPWGFGLVPTNLLLELQPLAMFSLAWIGLVIGMQADLKLWARAGMPTVRLSLALGAGSGIVAAIPTAILLWLAKQPPGYVLAGSLIMAAAAAASSCFRAGNGQLANLARACAGLDDLMSLLLAILPFALIGVSGAVSGISDTFLHTGVMALLGFFCGVAFILLVGPRARMDERLALCIGVIAVIAGTSAYLGVAPFVVAGFSGIVLVNTDIAPKEKIYEVLVNAERPIGLFLMLFAGALVSNPSWLALAIGVLWAVARILGRGLTAHLLNAPKGLEDKLVAVSPVVMVITGGFVLLAPTNFGPLLLQSAVLGWWATEAWVIFSNLRQPAEEVGA